MTATDRMGELRLVERMPLPESGAWYRTDGEWEGDPLWVCLPETPDDRKAVQLAWERLRHLDHPAIPKAVRWEPERGALVVAAPEGVPLRHLIEGRSDEAFAMTPGTVLDVGRQLSDVIVHGHERGRPHGHLSPECVWVTPEGRLVVWGYGAGPAEHGFPAWRSPERARGKRASGDADQWALGAIVASLITGRLPWEGDNADELAKVGDASHLSEPVLAQWKPLGRLVARALQGDPAQRFQSAHPLRQGISALQQRVGQPSGLAKMGEVLAQRFTQPKLAGVLAVTPQDVVRGGDTLQMPEENTAPSLEAPPIAWTPPPAKKAATVAPPLGGVSLSQGTADLGSMFEDVPTEGGTNPTMIPPTGYRTTVDEEPVEADGVPSVAPEPLVEVMVEGMPTEVPVVVAVEEPGSEAGLQMAYEPTGPVPVWPEPLRGGASMPGSDTLSNVQEAERFEPAFEPGEWDLPPTHPRRIAPYVVGLMGCMLVLRVLVPLFS